MELKSIITELNNSAEGLNSRFKQAEEGIGKLEGKAIEIIIWEQKDKQ